MRQNYLLLAGILTASCLATNAYSADPVELIDAGIQSSPLDQNVTLPVEVISGWYLRGDISGVFSRPRTFVGGDDTIRRVNNASFNKQPAFAAGIGYQLTDNFRSDLTVGYNQSYLRTAPYTAGGCTNGVVDGCQSSDVMRSNNWEVLANVYVDLPTEYGFIPYVGAGLGLARVSYKSGSRHFGCVNDGQVNDCGIASTTTGGVSWRPAWNLMAGIAVPISDFLFLDIGYKYTGTGNGTAYTVMDERHKDRGLSSHELRAGLRLNSW
ncbi:hypothetical protein CQ054_21885 [Ochrobactrum sp. MYb29]|nr:hypothetical protein CQ054_21885 [Ochrobactrum sp. MYb29]